MSSPLRLAYRTLLHLHPAGFRAEFGDEMLWIFDEESCNGNALHVMLDGFRSVVLQNLRSAPPPQPETANRIYVELDSSLPSERYAQAILTVMFCTLCFTLFASMVVPTVAVPLNKVLFRPIGLFSAGQFPHTDRSPSRQLPWRHKVERTASR